MRQLLATLLLAVLATGAAHAQNAPKKPPAIINPPPTAQDYADLGKLPDWSGVWNPKITDQDAQAGNNPPAWNETIAKEVAKRGIRVNTINPGPIDNEFMRTAERHMSGLLGRDAGDFFDQMIPLGRHGKPEEIARAVLFLASDHSAYTSGSALIDEVLAANQPQVASYREGKEGLFGFFVGQVMKASKGKANPKVVNERLKAKLTAS